MGAPPYTSCRIDGVGSAGRVYFTAPDGTRWRVYDRVYEPMVGWHALAPPAGGADHRVFVAQRGMRRVFEFKDHQSSAFTPSILDAQLRAAEDMNVECTDSTRRNPW